MRGRNWTKYMVVAMVTILGMWTLYALSCIATGSANSVASWIVGEYLPAMCLGIFCIGDTIDTDKRINENDEA